MRKRPKFKNSRSSESKTPPLKDGVDLGVTGENDSHLAKGKEVLQLSSPHPANVNHLLLDITGKEASDFVLKSVGRYGFLLQDLLAKYPVTQPIDQVTIKAISKKLWETAGVRFLFFDMFFDQAFRSTLGEILQDNHFNDRPFLNCAARISYSILNPQRMMNEFNVFRDYIADFLVYSIKADNGNLELYKLKPEQTPAIANEGIKYTRSQESAINALTSSFRIARGGLAIDGIRPRTTIFLVGISGSGKTAVIKEAAARESLPLFSHTLPAWIITGARSEPTLSTLSSWLQANPEGGVINIDEIEKIPVGKEEHNHSWFTAVRTEIVKLLDYDLQGFESYYNPLLAQILNRCVFVVSGNFQKLYQDQISREAHLSSSSVESDDWLLWRELQNLLPVTIQDIKEGKYLPDELLTRFSPNLVEVRPPTIEEISGYLASIDFKAGVYRSDVSIMEHAKEVFLSGQGFRGLENYVYTLLEKRDQEYRNNFQ